MSPTSFVPDRGDVVWMDFTPQAGHQQSGRRPAVVLSPAAYNAKVGLALVCPITSQAKGYPYEVDIPAGLGEPILVGGLSSLPHSAPDDDRDRFSVARRCLMNVHDEPRLPVERVHRPNVSTIKFAVSLPEKFCWPVIRLPSRIAKPRQRPACT